MSSSDELNELNPIDEELVAYLDDELGPSERARVERRLADDEPYRERLRSLQATWDALDLLPKTTAGDAFAATTVGMVAAREEVVLTQAIQQVKTQQSRRWLWVALAGLAAAMIGFIAVYRLQTQEDRELVRDLPVIEKVDQLRNTPSVDFLEQLQQEGLFLADANEP